MPRAGASPTTQAIPGPGRKVAAARAARLVVPAPTLAVERRLAVGGVRLVGGCDEVGRGALAGPVTVGMVVVDPARTGSLAGVRDSKLLSAASREELVPQIRSWAAGWGVGHASAAEIDAFGLVAALRLAGVRAWEAASAAARPDIVLLDGNQDWLGRKAQPALFGEAVADTPVPGAPSPPHKEPDPNIGVDVPVSLRIKADLACLSVAAASVLAKVERDALMAVYDEECPGFGWSRNKGYGTLSHRSAILELGPSHHHRRSWRLTDTGQGQ